MSSETFKADAVAVIDFAGERLDIAGLPDDTEPVAQPLDRRATHENTTLQSIFGDAVAAPGDRGQQAPF